jgi:hypothetical protein
VPCVQLELKADHDAQLGQQRNMATLSYHRFRTTLYTQLSIELGAQQARTFVLAPKSIKNTKPEYDMEWFAFDLIKGGGSHPAMSEFIEELSQTNLVRLSDAGFEYRFQAASPSTRWVRAIFDDELREAIMDFCHDSEEFSLYIHGGQQIVLSRMEPMEEPGEFKRFVKLGQLVLAKHSAASQAVPRTAGSEGDNPPCAACEDEIMVEPRACAECGAPYHEDCWHLLSECERCGYPINDAADSTGLNE